MDSVPTSRIIFPSLLFVLVYFISIVRYQVLLSQSYEPFLTQLQRPPTTRASTIIQLDDREGSRVEPLSNRQKQHHNSIDGEVLPWSHPLVHIVTTRFMQEQADLTNLTRARFELFDAICFPSMVNQEFRDLGVDTTAAAKTNPIDPHVIWIIKTDPRLEEVTKNRLIDLLEPHPNFYLIGTNANAKTWRNESMLTEMLNSEIYTGDRAMLMRVYEERPKKIILETRLDADDGLHRIYLQSMQRYALRTLNRGIMETKRPAWAAWCPLKNLEWYTTDDEQQEGSSLLRDLGGIKPVFNSQSCITAGLTIASSPYVDPKDIEIIQHQTLFQYGRVKGCGLPEKRDCVKLVSKPSVSAIRARTTTSAGMKDVGGGISKTNIELHPRVKNIVPVLREDERRSYMLLLDFGVEDVKLNRVKSYLQAHALGVAKDNLKGQCTRGHSCKDSSRAKLQRIIQDLTNSTKTVITY